MNVREPVQKTDVEAEMAPAPSEGTAGLPEEDQLPLDDQEDPAEGTGIIPPYVGRTF
jgi:hypothetical protein